MVKYFDIEYLQEATEFISNLEPACQKKALYCITYAQQAKDPEVFKKLTGSNIWKFRFIHKRRKYRLFAFWDKEIKSYVVCTHGIVKKTDKTPQKEIDKAEKIRIEYFKQKRK